MEIIDKENLIPDKNVLIKIIKEHPLCKNLDDRIRNLTIKLAQSGCCIELDKNKDVTLFLTGKVSSKSNYKYILFHEFSHICDKLNPKFKYTDKKRDALTDIEKHAVMEIWNVYIDSRLNKLGLFDLGNENKNNVLRINGKLQRLPHDIESDLMCRANFLQTRGINNAKIIVEDIWGNPVRFLSYDDMIDIIKLNHT